MSGAETPVVAPVALAELKAMLRVGSGQDDAALVALIASATALCEAFLGSPLIVRGFEEMVRPGGWRALARRPVHAIDEVSGTEADGGSPVLPPERYAIDIQDDGIGMVRIDGPQGGMRVAVSYRAGLARDWNGVAEPIRQGVLRLAAHMHMDDAAALPPAAVAALWRPYRRMRIA